MHSDSAVTQAAAPSTATTAARRRPPMQVRDRRTCIDAPGAAPSPPRLPLVIGRIVAAGGRLFAAPRPALARARIDPCRPGHTALDTR